MDRVLQGQARLTEWALGGLSQCLCDTFKASGSRRGIERRDERGEGVRREKKEKERGGGQAVTNDNRCRMPL